MDDFEPDPKEREKSTFWQGFAAGFMYFLFLLLLKIFVGPYLTEAEAWIMPLVITGLLIWIGSKKEDVELKVFTGATFVLAAILTPFIFEFLEPLGENQHCFAGFARSSHCIRNIAWSVLRSSNGNQKALRAS
jgi:hypothetical protein